MINIQNTLKQSTKPIKHLDDQKVKIDKTTNIQAIKATIITLSNKIKDYEKSKQNEQSKFASNHMILNLDKIQNIKYVDKRNTDSNQQTNTQSKM